MNIGFDDTAAALVPTVDFQYPDEGDEPAPVVRDQWREAPLVTKCQQRFATVPSGGVMTMPLPTSASKFPATPCAKPSRP